MWRWLPDQRRDAERCTQAPWLNLAIASSNWITGLWAVYVMATSNRAIGLDVFLVIGALLASTFYHLGERKGLLPGIEPFRKREYALLTLDRVFTVLLGTRLIWHMLHMPWVSAAPIFGVGAFGIVSSLVSEYLTGVAFVVAHGTWHVTAFLIPLMIEQVRVH